MGGCKATDQKFVVGILFASFFYEGVIEDDNDDDDERWAMSRNIQQVYNFLDSRPYSISIHFLLLFLFSKWSGWVRIRDLFLNNIIRGIVINYIFVCLLYAQDATVQRPLNTEIKHFV